MKSVYITHMFPFHRIFIASTYFELKNKKNQRQKYIFTDNFNIELDVDVI